MSAKSVDEGRKAAAFNVLFMLPVSALIVGSAGWIGKALLQMDPSPLNPNVNPDEVFIAVTHIIASKGVFGFVLAALTATLLSTVDSLINAIAAVYINDVHQPLKKLIKSKIGTEVEESKKDLGAARWASIFFTGVGVLATLPFNQYPTVYQAHGYFHSTLTPPLVTAIFLGVFWRKFTPAGVLATFIGGSSLMILGARYPYILITPFAHGTPFDPVHPYTYISALYNTFVCFGIGVLVTYLQPLIIKVSNGIRTNENHRNIMFGANALIVILLALIWLNIGSMVILLFAVLVLAILVSISAVYFIKFDPNAHLEGLTVWSIKRAKELFKGSKVNEKDGKKVFVKWRLRDDDIDVVNLSIEDMKEMAAEVGDIVYLCDARKYLGGLKSVHTRVGEPHDDKGLVFISKEHELSAIFQEDKMLYAEKEM
jgi:Na+(H+)/acetate symporter ActP